MFLAAHLEFQLTSKVIAKYVHQRCYERTFRIETVSGKKNKEILNFNFLQSLAYSLELKRSTLRQNVSRERSRPHRSIPSPIIFFSLDLQAPLEFRRKQRS